MKKDKKEKTKNFQWNKQKQNKTKQNNEQKIIKMNKNKVGNKLILFW